MIMIVYSNVITQRKSVKSVTKSCANQSSVCIQLDVIELDRSTQLIIGGSSVLRPETDMFRVVNASRGVSTRPLDCQVNLFSM